MKYAYLYIIVIGLSAMLSCSKSEIDPATKIEIPEGYSLIWNDEFDQNIINPNNWSYETGDGTDYGLPAGWGNNEKQIYTDSPENSNIEAVDNLSVLSIKALKDGTGAYTSAKLTTKDLQSIRFGRIDVKAKMPEGQGIWPAIWLLGDNIDLIEWPGCGEVDIVEVIGSDPTTYYSTLHFTNSEKKHEEIQKDHVLSVGSFSDNYHVFSLEWSHEYLTFIIDGLQIQQVPIEDDMKEFLRSFYLVINVAVGGYWPGDPDETTVFPQSMLVDYIRVFSKDGYLPPEAPVLDIEEETIGQVIEPNIGDNAIMEGFTDLGNLKIISYGGGGEPEISTSETSIDGDLSLVFTFPGNNWGGAYFELLDNKDLSAYAYLNFSLKIPSLIVDAEIKLESTGSDASIFLKDYTGTGVAEGFVEYSIPLTDFIGLDLTTLKIPFSIWNPMGEYGNFAPGEILIDKIHFLN